MQNLPKRQTRTAKPKNRVSWAATRTPCASRVIAATSSDNTSFGTRLSTSAVSCGDCPHIRDDTKLSSSPTSLKPAGCSFTIQHHAHGVLSQGGLGDRPKLVHESRSERKLDCRSIGKEEAEANVPRTRGTPWSAFNLSIKHHSESSKGCTRTLAKRLRMRPAGVVSKKCMGALTTCGKQACT